MRNRLMHACGAVFAVLFFASCQSQAGGRRTGAVAQDSESFDLPAACETVQRQNAEFTRAHVTGDVAAIDGMFTQDAKSFPPGADAAVGLPAIHALTVEFLKAGIKEFREETTDCYGTDDLLVDQGTYVVVYGPDSTTEHGKYLNVWKQVGGAWRIHANIWNTSPAGAAPPP